MVKYKWTRNIKLKLKRYKIPPARQFVHPDIVKNIKAHNINDKPQVDHRN